MCGMGRKSGWIKGLKNTLNYWIYLQVLVKNCGLYSDLTK